MASAEATVTTLKAEREELHLTDRTVLHSETGRLTDREGAMAATATTEERGDHLMVVLHSEKAVHPTDSAEAMATTTPRERREDHLTDRAVLHSVRDAHHTDREEATAQGMKAAREGLHIQGSRRLDTDSALSREDSQPAEERRIRALRSSAARTSRTSQRLTRLESTRCSQGSHRLTRLSPTTTTFLHLSRRRYVSTSTSPTLVYARAARLTTSSRPAL